MKVGVKKLLRAGLVPARTVHAVVMSPTERFFIEKGKEREEGGERREERGEETVRGKDVLRKGNSRGKEIGRKEGKERKRKEERGRK